MADAALLKTFMTVQYGSGLAELFVARPAVRDRARKDMETRLSSLLSELGIPGSSQVHLEEATLVDGLRVLTGFEPLPVPSECRLRLYHVIAGLGAATERSQEQLVMGGSAGSWRMRTRTK